MPGIASYCVTKAMCSAFTEALSFEVRDKMDVTCWDAGPAFTNLGNGEQPPKAISLTASQAVEDILRQLGKTRKTNGSLKYDMLSITSPPLDLVGSKIGDGIRQKYIESQMSKKNV